MTIQGMPEGGPLIYPGPYRFEKLDMYNFFCQTQTETNFSRFIPKGIRLWNPLFPKGMIQVVICHYPKAYADATPDITFSYQEAVIFVPCFHIKKGPVVYCPFIYLNNVLAMAVGREIYGFPKKLTDVTIEKLGNSRTASVTSENKEELLNVKWKNREQEGSVKEVVKNMVQIAPKSNLIKGIMKTGMKLIDIEKRLQSASVSVLNWRRIPDVSATIEKPKWSVNELAAACFTIDNIYSMNLLDVEEHAVALKGGLHDPLHKFGPLKTVLAFKLNMDFTLMPGKVIQKYSKKGKPGGY